MYSVGITLFIQNVEFVQKEGDLDKKVNLETIQNWQKDLLSQTGNLATLK